MAFIQVRNGRPQVVHRHADGRITRETASTMRAARTRAAELQQPAEPAQPDTTRA
jgi:hypothetical protein